METLFLDNRKLKIFRLILTNAIPFFGVLFFGWSLFLILFYYLLENVVIGFFNVFKMLVVTVVQKQKKGIFLIPFFILHFSGFLTVHLSFLLLFFADQDSFLNNFHGSHDDLWQMVLLNLLPMFFGYLVTFFDFLQHHRLEIGLDNLMFSPYLRIFVMHLVILIGGAILMLFKAPAVIILFLIFVKIVMDYIFSKITFSCSNKIATRV